MKLQDQVCTLIHAKKLKEVGVIQESLYRWQCISGEWEPTALKREYIEENNYNKETFAAFTATELLSILPNSVCVPNAEPFDHFKICIRKFISVDENLFQHNNFILNYECDTTEATGERAWLARQLTSNMYDPNLANVCAEMLVYLKSGGLMPQ